MSNVDSGTDSDAKQIEGGHQSIRAYVSDLIFRSAPTSHFDAKKIIDENPEIRNHRSLVLDLVYEEYCRRKEAGEDIGQATFVQNFPDYKHSLLQVLQVHQYLEKSGVDSERNNIEWPTPGETFGDYQLLDQIGRGSFAQVFLAEQISVDRRRVVLKITRNALDEVKTLAHLKHPRIVEIYTVASNEDGFTAICMPLISEVTLFDVLVDLHADSKVATSKKDFASSLERCFKTRTSETSTVPFSSTPPPKMDFIDAAIRVGIDIADALEYSHGQGFLHCDIKPTNILITPDGHSMLFDFNLSAKSDSKTGRIGGTLPYMPPEQLQALVDGDFDFEMTAAADIFSFGVTLFQLLTGTLPFDDVPDASKKEDAAKIMLKRQRNTRINLEQVKGINPSFKKLILQCLSFIPDARPSSATLAKRLRAEETFTKRSRRWMILHPVKTSIAAAVLIGSLPACLWLYHYATQLNRQQFISTIEEGKAAQEARDFPRAIDLFKLAIERSQSNPKRKFLAECFLAMAYAHCGKDHDARESLAELRSADKKEQRGLVAEILLASVGSRRKILDVDSASVGVTEITLRNLKRFDLDHQNNFWVIRARQAGYRQSSLANCIDRFEEILKRSPRHGQANYNRYLFMGKLKGGYKKEDSKARPIDPILIAIDETAPRPEYLSRVVTFYVNRYIVNPSPQGLDDVVKWLTRLRDSGMPKSVLNMLVNKPRLVPLPQPIKDVVDTAKHFEPIQDLVHLHGIVDPLTKISIEDFLSDN